MVRNFYIFIGVVIVNEIYLIKIANTGGAWDAQTPGVWQQQQQQQQQAQQQQQQKNKQLMGLGML